MPGLISIFESGVNIYTIGSFTLYSHVSFVESAFNCSVIHQMFYVSNSLRILSNTVFPLLEPM